MAEENTEKEKLIVPQNLLNQYKQLVNQLNDLRNVTLDLNIEAYKAKKKADKATESLVEAQLLYDVLMNQIKDSCKIDRNKNYNFNLDEGCLEEV